MILPDTGHNLYSVIKNNIKNIGYVQKRIRFYVESPDTFPKNIILPLSSIFMRRPKRIMKLYAEQLNNVSSLNSKLPEAMYSSRKELKNIERKIDDLYSCMVSRSDENKIFENETNLVAAELLEINPEETLYEMMKKSSLERKLGNIKHARTMSRNYLQDTPKEISLLEYQRKILHDCVSRCELVLQKSKHIESILTSCLTGIISVSQKQDLMLHLGIAFYNVNEYVRYVTDYTATELINATSHFSQSSFKMDIAMEDGASNIDALNFM